jgi:hypothetical protein
MPIEQADELLPDHPRRTENTYLDRYRYRHPISSRACLLNVPRAVSAPDKTKPAACWCRSTGCPVL